MEGINRKLLTRFLFFALQRNEDIMKAPGRIWLKPDACPVIVNNDTLLLPSSDSDDYVVIKEEEPEGHFFCQKWF